jgi:hypothetical protein
LRPLQERGRRCAISVSSERRKAFAEHMRVADVGTAVVADTEVEGQPGIEIFATIGTPGSVLQVHTRAA